MFPYITCTQTALWFVEKLFSNLMLFKKQTHLSKSNQRVVSVPVTQRNFSLVFLHVSIQKARATIVCTSVLSTGTCVYEEQRNSIKCVLKRHVHTNSSANCTIHYDEYHSYGRWVSLIVSRSNLSYTFPNAKAVAS